MVWALKKYPTIPNWHASSAARAMQNELWCSKCCNCHAKPDRGAPSAAPATHIDRRCSKCCPCHEKRAWLAPSAARPKSITRRQTSADLYEGAPSAAHATQNEPEVLQVLRPPRKTKQRCSKCCTCHAKQGWGAPSALPATQNEPDSLQVVPLPRKTRRPHKHHSSPDFRRPPWRGSKRCTCHAKRAWGAPSACHAKRAWLAPSAARPKSITRRQSSADIYEGAPSAAPAMQKHAWGAPSVAPDFRRSPWRCSKCYACHAKGGWGAPSAAPATENDAGPKSITHRQTLADLYEGAPSAAPATQNEPEVLQVLGLPLKTSLTCSKCCACHAKQARGAPSAAPATQKDAGPKSITRRQTSANLYEGAPSGATQNEAAPIRITCHQTSTDLYEGAWSGAPATQKEPDSLQVLRLLRKTRRRPKASLIAGLPPTCACHAKRAGGAPSAAPATKKKAAPKSITRRQTSADLMKRLQALRLPRKRTRTWDDPSAAPGLPR